MSANSRSAFRMGVNDQWPPLLGALDSFIELGLQVRLATLPMIAHLFILLRGRRSYNPHCRACPTGCLLGQCLQRTVYGYSMQRNFRRHAPFPYPRRRIPLRRSSFFSLGKGVKTSAWTVSSIKFCRSFTKPWTNAS